MIVYLATKEDFAADVLSNRIEEQIHNRFKEHLGRSVGASEVESWKNSLVYMDRILSDSSIPADSGIAIEFNIPQTSKRIDFIVTGLGSTRQKTAVIIELKQWSEVAITDQDAIVRTRLGGALRNTAHPSYQVWSYAALLEDYNEAVRSIPVYLKPCAYLHNLSSGSVIQNQIYKDHLEKAPAFLKDDAAKLRSFIKQHIRYGDKGDIIYEIRDGKISPSKSLADALESMMRGNREFLMIDDQKLVYEAAISLSKAATGERKQVLIVEGGPGTGKSVVAINLLVSLTSKGKVVQYVTKNAAPRAVYQSKLSGSMSKTRISNLFVGSGGYTEAEPNTFDALIVDEAHRLNEKSGLYGNLGENQIKELIRAAKLAVFFVDEDQRVTFSDIGDKAEIRCWAESFGADVHETSLTSQFRCNGSDGYLAWVDDVLQIRETANQTVNSINYHIEVLDSATQLREAIVEKNGVNNRARMVAGYCWDWVSKNSSTSMDIVIPKDGFSARWNLTTDGSLWILAPSSVAEVGCIHTCQGLELDYIGVIIGPDLIVRGGKVQVDPTKRSRGDKSLKGYKTLKKNNPAEAEAKAEMIILNTYRTLMTRGQKGCFIYSVDPETNEYFKGRATPSIDG